jgi:hypothetical protein
MATRARARGNNPNNSNFVIRLSRIKTIAQRPTTALLGCAFLVAVGMIVHLIWGLDTFLISLRDHLFELFGFGFVIPLVLMLVFFAHRKWGGSVPVQKYLRLVLGFCAAALFIWGVLGFISLDWNIGDVHFGEMSLGGRIGQSFVDGYIAILIWIAWLLLAVISFAPNSTKKFLMVKVPLFAKWIWNEKFIQNTSTFFVLIIKKLGSKTIEKLKHFYNRSYPAPVIGAPRLDHNIAVINRQVVFRPAGDSRTIAASTKIVKEEVANNVDSESIFPVSIPLPFEDLDPVLGNKDVVLAEDEEDIERISVRGGWELPPFELFEEPAVKLEDVSNNDARGQLIVDTLASFGVDASVVEINEGPTVTQFGVEPGWAVKTKSVVLRDENGKAHTDADGKPLSEEVEVSRTRVRVNRITALQNDLALALAAPSLRIEAPVPGRPIVGIEVPNSSSSIVTLRKVMQSKEFRSASNKSKLAIALGEGVSGKPIVADLAKMPHLLIAGATGSGKSVCINTIISSILASATPDEVRFVLVDPKRVELTNYGKLPHLAFSEVIVDLEKVVGTLQAIVSEMEARYKRFAEYGVRNISSYNSSPRVAKRLPEWVVIIDELADLMMVASFEVEKLLCRLAQLSRATGIHLIVATQRPSVDVVTGLIKANFPTRIAFAVTSITDSRTILDMGGAEKLLGQGDMLYLPTDAGKPSRIQGAFVSEAEVEALVKHWRRDDFVALRPEMADNLLDEALIVENGGGDDFEVDANDPILDNARLLAGSRSRISPSLLQRRLGIGSVKARRIINQLEVEGVVGPENGGESREVLVE